MNRTSADLTRANTLCAAGRQLRGEGRRDEAQGCRACEDPDLLLQSVPATSADRNRGCRRGAMSRAPCRVAVTRSELLSGPGEAFTIRAVWPVAENAGRSPSVDGESERGSSSMGLGYSTRCRACGYEETVYAGVGMLTGTEHGVLEQFLCQCERCGLVAAHPAPLPPCPACSGQLVPIDDFPDQSTCPRCGQRDLQFLGHELWD